MENSVETERLLLRRFREDDIGAFVPIYGDPEGMVYMGKGAKTPEETERSIRGKMAHWEQRGFGLWCVVLKKTGAVIGHCGLGWLEPLGEVEAAYLIARSHWNQGLATEGVMASIGWGFERLGLDRIIAIAHPEHVASQRVMEKCGMTYRDEVTVWDHVFRRYAIERGERR